MKCRRNEDGDEDGGDLAIGAEAANALHELHRHEATTIPDDGAGFGEQEDGGLTNGNRWIKLMRRMRGSDSSGTRSNVVLEMSFLCDV